MNWDWASSLDQLWRSPTLPMWLTLAATGFFGLLLLVTLLRAERSVANGALAVMTLVAIAIAVASTLRDSGSNSEAGKDPAVTGQTTSSATPALACLDDLAGETALTACEKLLFGSPDTVAAAVAYAARQVSRLTALGDVAAANRVMTPDLQALRRAVERDRYGLVAYVLSVRDRCQPAQCPAYGSLTDHNQIAANMDERIYEASINKYAASWNAAPVNTTGTAALTLANQPTGKPTNAEFPTAASTPPVSIMTPEPPAAPAAAPRPSAPAVAQSASPKPPAAPKKQPAAAAPRPRAAAPTPLSPAPGSNGPSTALQ